VLAYFQVSQRTGAEVIVVGDDDSGQIDVAALAGLVDERTKLIGLSWVPTADGLVNPAAEVGRIAREADALFLLDATQVVGQAVRRRDPLGHMGWRPIVALGRRRAALRNLGEQLRQRRRPRRHRWRDHPRSRPRAVCHRDGEGRKRRQRDRRGSACGAADQRQHDGG
jgi:Aminotransferase class-V